MASSGTAAIAQLQDQLAQANRQISNLKEEAFFYKACLMHNHIRVPKFLPTDWALRGSQKRKISQSEPHDDHYYCDASETGHRDSKRQRVDDYKFRPTVPDLQSIVAPTKPTVQISQPAVEDTPLILQDTYTPIHEETRTSILGDTHTTDKQDIKDGPPAHRTRGALRRAKEKVARTATSQSMTKKAGVKKRAAAKKPTAKTAQKKPGGPRKVTAKTTEEAIEVVESHQIPTTASCSPETMLKPALQPLPEVAAESVPVTESLSEPVSESAQKASPAPGAEPMPAAEPSPSPDAASTTANATETALIVRPSESALAARKNEYQSFAQPLALVNGNIVPGSFPAPPATMPVTGDLRHDSFIANMSNQFQKQQEAFQHLNTKLVENTTSAPKVLAQSASFIPQQSMSSSGPNAASSRPALDKKHAFRASSMPSHSSATVSASFPSSTSSHFQFTTTKTFSSQSSSSPLFGTSTQPSIADFATPAFTLPRSAQMNKRRAQPTTASAPPMPSVDDAKDELPDEPEELRPDGSEYYELKHDVLTKASALYNRLPQSMQDSIATRKALTAPEQKPPQSPPAEGLPYTPEQAAETERIYHESLVDPLDDDADFETKNQRACRTLNAVWPDNCTRFDVDREYEALKLLIHPDVNKHSKATEAMNRVNLAYAVLDQYLNAEAQNNPEEKRGRYAQIGDFQRTDREEAESTERMLAHPLRRRNDRRCLRLFLDNGRMTKTDGGANIVA